jgi:hypothetical protein
MYGDVITVIEYLPQNLAVVFMKNHAKLPKHLNLPKARVIGVDGLDIIHQTVMHPHIRMVIHLILTMIHTIQTKK